tara:strand:+ start:542 stop:856 length:315 start_codon:yes stop_codon:yes gene_type:complete
MTNVNINGVSRKMTAEEQAEFDAQQTAWNNKSAERKLAEIRQIRNQKLQETDWLVISEQISDEQKTWRENLRKIPQDYTTENQYDLLLARNDDGKLTHSIWEKP